jgi:hypothetical protein
MTERHNAFFTDMAEATRLTRAGRLGEATALIQRSLGAAGSVPERPQPADAQAPRARFRGSTVRRPGSSRKRMRRRRR